MPVKRSKKATGGGTKNSSAQLRAISPRRTHPGLDDDRLYQEYVTFLSTLDAEFERLRELRVKTLNKLDEDREACYQKTANMYTQEQLNMTIPELEAHLNAHEQNKDALNEVENSDKPTTVKIKAYPKRKPVARRSSFVNQFTTPGTTFRIRKPKFLTTGIKDSNPRPGRLGELVYSENGSPVVIVGERPKLAQLRLNGKTVEEEHV